MKYYEHDTKHKENTNYTVSTYDTVTIIYDEDEEIEAWTIMPITTSFTPRFGSGNRIDEVIYIEETHEHSNIEIGEISEKSPLAQAIMGKILNESFSFKTPTGKKVSGRILRIEKGNRK